MECHQAPVRLRWCCVTGAVFGLHSALSGREVGGTQNRAIFGWLRRQVTGASIADLIRGPRMNTSTKVSKEVTAINRWSLL